MSPSRPPSRPSLTSAPAQGSTLGGTIVTIHGRHFRAQGHSLVKKVTFGKSAATKVHVRSATLITVRAPRGSSTVNVRVTTTAGRSAKVSADRYAYTAPVVPVVGGLSPTTGSKLGGTIVTITGSSFTGASAVAFGGHAATSFTVPSDGQIVATAPAGTGAVDVTVTAPAGTSATSATDQFTYYAPATVTGVSPTFGPAVGGTTVTITGSVLFAASAVNFGTASASFTRISNSKIVATAPAGTGTVDVTVTTPAGTSATSPADRFIYATQIAVNAGDNQTATAGSAVATAPSVLVSDGHGNPVAGVSVTFAVASGGGSLTGGSATTDASGIATAGGWTLGTGAGPNTLTATGAGLSLTFHATGAAGAATQMSVNAGDNQTATAGSAVATAPSVLVSDGHGNPVAGVNVTFAVASGGGSASGSPVTTDAAGIATAGGWTLGTSAGPNTLTATGAGLSPVTFHATGAAGAATHLLVTAPAAGTAGVSFDVTVTAEDAYGNTAAGYRGTVTFSSSDPAATLPGDYTFTGGDGGSHTFGSGATLFTAGGQTVTAVDTGTSSITGTSDTVSVSP